MRGQKELYKLLERLSIEFEYHEHPPLATIEDAKIHWNESDRLAFHPNLNIASLVISKSDFLKFLTCTGNSFEFIRLYD